jgi:glycerol-3-phosphate dehydrogenase
MAEEAVTAAEHVLTPRTCRTRTLALEDDQKSAIECLATSDLKLQEPIHPRLPYRHADVVWAVRNAMARTLEDVLARRTRALMLDAMASMEAAEGVAALMAQELGWSDHDRQTQIAQYCATAGGYLPSGKSD